MTKQWWGHGARLIVRVLAALLLVLTVRTDVVAQATTVVLVRHAEKVDDSADPLLSADGTARAEMLAEALADAGILGIYTTQYQRTILTATPLAARLGLEPVVVRAAGRDHAADVARRVLQEGAPAVALIVGHSNSVPDIIRALGGPDVGAIDDSEYDRLFVITLAPGGPLLIRSRYGSASPR